MSNIKLFYLSAMIMLIAPIQGAQDFVNISPDLNTISTEQAEKVDTLFSFPYDNPRKNILAIPEELIQNSVLYKPFSSQKNGKTFSYPGVSEEIINTIKLIAKKPLLDPSLYKPLFYRWLEVMTEVAGKITALTAHVTNEPGTIIFSGDTKKLYESSLTFKIAMQVHDILADNITSFLLAACKTKLEKPLEFRYEGMNFGLFSTQFRGQPKYFTALFDSTSENFTSYMSYIWLTRENGLEVVTIFYDRTSAVETSGFFLNLNDCKAPIIQCYDASRRRSSEVCISVHSDNNGNTTATFRHSFLMTAPLGPHILPSLLTDIKKTEKIYPENSTEVALRNHHPLPLVPTTTPQPQTNVLTARIILNFMLDQLKNKFGPLRQYLHQSHLGESLFIPFPCSRQEQNEAQYAEDLFQAEEAFKEIADTQQLLLTYNNALPKNEEVSEKYNRLEAKREAALSRIKALSSRYVVESDVIIVATIEGKLLSLHQENYARAVEEEQVKIRNALNKRSLPGILKETSISCQKAVRQYLRERNNDTARHDAISVVQQKFLTDIRTRHKDRRYVLQAFHHHLAENGITFHTSQNGSHIVTHTRGAKALTVVEEHRGTAPFSGKVIEKMIGIFNDALRYAAQNHT